MKFWNRLFNRGVAPAAPSIPTRSPDSNNVPILFGPAANESGDSFQKHFAGPPYFPNAVMRPTGFYVSRHPVLTGDSWKSVFAKAGGDSILSKGEKQKLRDLKQQFDEIDGKLANLSFFSVNKLVRDQQGKAVEALLAGEAPPLCPSHIEMTNSVVSTRRALHDAKRKISPEVHAIVEKVEAAMRKAARALAEELDKKERTAHEQFFGNDRPFSPSALLVAVVWIALAGVNSATRNFKLTGLLTPPDPDNLIAIYWNPAPTPQPLPIRREVARNDHEKAAELAASEARKLAVVERNKLVEKIRLDAQASRLSAADAKTMKQAEEQLRMAEAVETLRQQKAARTQTDK